MTVDNRPPWDPDPRYVSPLERVTPACVRCGQADDHYHTGPEVYASRTGPTIPLLVGIGLVVIGVLLVVALASRVAPDPTAPQSGDPGATGSVGVSALAPAGASGPTLLGAPTVAAGAPLSPAVGFEPARGVPTAPTPGPSGEIGSPLEVARGWATWYDDGPGLYGAVHSWRFGDDRYAVQVCAFGGGRTNCIHVVVRDFCACGSRRGVPTVIDLSPAAFRQLAPLSRGVIRVEVSGPIEIPLPPTDTEVLDR